MARDYERGRMAPGPEHWYPEFEENRWRDDDRSAGRGDHPFGGDRQSYGQQADRPYAARREARMYGRTRDEEAIARGGVRHEPDLYPTFGDDYLTEYRDWRPGMGDDRRHDDVRTRPPAGPFAGRGPRGYQRSNERIHEEVSDRLAEHPWIDASQIDVAVDNGVVTLTGSVEDRTQKRMAEDVVDSVSGVRDVQNQLRIEPALRDGGSQRFSEQVFTP